MGRAAFLLPWGVIVPERALPPRILYAVHAVRSALSFPPAAVFHVIVRLRCDHTTPLMYTAPVAPRIVLHELPGEKRAGVLVRLVEGLYTEGHKVVVWVEDEGRRQILDDFLWTFRQLSFVPHRIWVSGMESPVEPVVLVGEAVNPIAARVLVVGDEMPPLEWAAEFEEVHDLIPPGEAGEARTAAWRKTGWPIA